MRASYNEHRTAIMVPDWRNANPYQTLLANALSRRGVNVAFRDIPAGAFPLNRIMRDAGDAPIIHIHWINDLVAPVLWSRQKVKSWIKLALLTADLMLLKARGIKLIWTVHNLVAHDSPDPARELSARRILARFSTRIIVHSASALNSIEKLYGLRLRHKAAVIPHGNYDGCYSQDLATVRKIRERFGIDESHTTLLFFGAIRQYKGLQRLISAFREARGSHLRLIIAGKAKPETFEEVIRKAAIDDERIQFMFGFIDEAEVAPLFAACDVVVIPFERTLTSGSTVLALTMGKATLLPVEAKVFDLVDESSGIFFESTSDLRHRIESLDRSLLLEMGRRARLTADQLQWDDIGKALAAIYK